MVVKKVRLCLIAFLLLFISLGFSSAHVCGDVVGGSQAGCPDPQTVTYISHSTSDNVVTIQSDITALHIVWCPATGCNYDNADYDYACNDGGDWTSGFTVQSFTKSIVPGGHGDISKISISSSPSLPSALSDGQTRRFSIYLTVDPSAPTQHFDVRVAMLGSLSGTARPIYDVTINWVNDAGGECTTENQSVACNDNNVCTNDICSSGVCTHPANTASCASDGNECTNDICSGGTCTHPALTGSSCTSDSNTCTNDICSSNTTCMHNPITSCINGDGCCPAGCTYQNDNNCLQCTVQNQSTDCDDDNECTTDTCPSGSCIHSSLADMTNCSSNLGKCCGGFCDTSLGNTNFAVDCRTGPACSSQSWQYNAANEGVACTLGICSSGLCQEDSGEEDDGGSSGGGGGGGGSTEPSITIHTLTRTQLVQGYSAEYSSGDEAKMTVSGVSHKMVVQNINPPVINILVNSTPQLASLVVGETRKFSFTPGIYELAVTLNKITGSGTSAEANITILSVFEQIPVERNASAENNCNESWECSEWEQCVDGIQSRVCADSNNCGTEEDKPLIEQGCNKSKNIIRILIYFLIIAVIIVVLILFFNWRKNKMATPSVNIPPSGASV